MTIAFKTDAGRDAVLAAYRNLIGAVKANLPLDELRIPTREGETFILACGPKDAPPLLAFHGAQANAASFFGDLPLWSRHFRVYAVDMIGEAGFSAEARPPLDSDAHALWLDDLLAALKIERAAFTGISLGGWLAGDYAARRPGRVTQLALLCPAGIGRNKNFLLRVLPLLFLGEWGRRKMRDMVIGDMPAGEATPPQFGQFIEMMTLIGAHIRPRIVKIPLLSDAQIAALPPTLAIVGGKDVLIDSDDTKRRLEVNSPRTRVIYLPEAKHFIPGQSQAILDFLLTHVAEPVGGT